MHNGSYVCRRAEDNSENGYKSEIMSLFTAKVFHSNIITTSHVMLLKSTKDHPTLSTLLCGLHFGVDQCSVATENMSHKQRQKSYIIPQRS